jgi:hypothetical protein
MTKHDESSRKSLQIISQSHDMLKNMLKRWWENQVAERKPGKNRKRQKFMETNRNTRNKIKENRK